MRVERFRELTRRDGWPLVFRWPPSQRGSAVAFRANAFARSNRLRVSARKLAPNTRRHLQRQSGIAIPSPNFCGS